MLCLIKITTFVGLQKRQKLPKKFFKKSFPKGLFLCLKDLFGLIKGLLLQTESILPLAKIKL